MKMAPGKWILQLQHRYQANGDGTGSVPCTPIKSVFSQPQYQQTGTAPGQAPAARCPRPSCPESWSSSCRGKPGCRTGGKPRATSASQEIGNPLEPFLPVGQHEIRGHDAQHGAVTQASGQGIDQAHG